MRILVVLVAVVHGESHGQSAVAQIAPGCGRPARTQIQRVSSGRVISTSWYVVGLGPASKATVEPQTIKGSKPRYAARHSHALCGL